MISSTCVTTLLTPTSRSLAVVKCTGFANTVKPSEREPNFATSFLSHITLARPCQSCGSSRLCFKPHLFVEQRPPANNKWTSSRSHLPELCSAQYILYVCLAECETEHPPDLTHRHRIANILTSRHRGKELKPLVRAKVFFARLHSTTAALTSYFPDGCCARTTRVEVLLQMPCWRSTTLKRSRHAFFFEEICEISRETSRSVQNHSFFGPSCPTCPSHLVVLSHHSCLRVLVRVVQPPDNVIRCATTDNTKVLTRVSLSIHSLKAIHGK